jgi:hypothetical protein
MRPNSRSSFLYFFRICDWLSYIAALTRFHYYPGCDIPQNQTTLYMFLGRDYTTTLTYSYLRRNPHLFFPYFHCNGRRFSLFCFGLALVLGLVEGFNGMEWKMVQAIPLPIYAEYLNVFAYHTLALPTAVLQQHIFLTIGRCMWLA